MGEGQNREEPDVRITKISLREKQSAHPGYSDVRIRIARIKE
jgi:hypothetical protein